MTPLPDPKLMVPDLIARIELAKIRQMEMRSGGHYLQLEFDVLSITETHGIIPKPKPRQHQVYRSVSLRQSSRPLLRLVTTPLGIDHLDDNALGRRCYGVLRWRDWLGIYRWELAELSKKRPVTT